MREIPPIFAAIARHVRGPLVDHPVNVVGKGRRLRLTSGAQIAATLVELAGTNLAAGGRAEIHDSNQAIEDLLASELALTRPFFKHFRPQLQSFLTALGDTWIDLDQTISYRVECDAVVPGSRMFHFRVRVHDSNREFFTDEARVEDLGTLPPPTRMRQPIPRLLPAPPRDWVGREVELQRLRAFLTDDARRLAVVRGHAGSGKTSLLAKLCSELAPLGRLTDTLAGLVYVSCREVPHAPVQELAEALGNTCGDPRHLTAIVNSGQSFDAQARDLLVKLQGTGPVAVILDDLHALLRRGDLSDHGQLAVFIVTVATTNNNVRLIVAVQDAFTLPRDVSQTRIELGPLAVNEAAEYLRRTLLPHDSAHDPEPPELRAVAERERVSPMHLRSVVSFLAGQSTYALADLASERQDAMRALDGHPERHGMIDRFVEQIRRLPPESQRLLRELAVLDRPLSVNALEAMDVRAHPSTLDALAPLLEQSDQGIYLHSTVRDATISCLSRDPTDDQRIHANAARYFARQPIPVTGAVLADTAPLQYAAEHFIQANEPSRALKVVRRLDADYLRPAGQWESIVRHRRALQPLLRQTSERLQNLSELGIPLTRLGLARESVRSLLQARAIARRVRSVTRPGRPAPTDSADRIVAAHDAEVRALNNLGVAYTNMRFVSLARAAYERAVEDGEEQLRTAPTPAMSERVARRYRNLADACHQTGDLARARWCVHRARELSEPSNPAVEGSHLAKMGVIHLKEGLVWEARSDLEQSIAISSAHGSTPDARLHATRLGSLAAVWLHARMHHPAHTAVDEAIAVFERLGTAVHLVAMIERKAEIAQDSGDLATAQLLYERGRMLCREKRDYRGAVRQALLLTEIGSPAASNALKESILLCRWYLRFNPTMYTALHALGAAQLALGDLKTAWETYERSLAIIAAPGVIEEARRPLRWLDRAGVHRDVVRECDARLVSFVPE